MGIVITLHEERKTGEGTDAAGLITMPSLAVEHDHEPEKNEE